MRLTSRVFSALACLALLSLNSSAATPVILISVDTLRADHLGRNTPHIDALAKKYLGVDTYPMRQPGEVRVTYVVKPDKVVMQPADA